MGQCSDHENLHNEIYPLGQKSMTKTLQFGTKGCDISMLSRNFDLQSL